MMRSTRKSAALVAAARFRARARLAPAGRLVACALAGVGVGTLVAGSLTPVDGRNREDAACEYDKCGGTINRGCEDSGGQRTNCNLHAFGCGTIPCGTTFATLATFESPRSTELWMAFGPAAVPPLVEHVMDDDYPHRVEVLRTLARMAREWDVDKLESGASTAMVAAAARHVAQPLVHVPPEERVATLVSGIDLAAALDDRYLTASVRALENPDSVRARLVNDELDHQAVVRHARRSR